MTTHFSNVWNPEFSTVGAIMNLSSIGAALKEKFCDYEIKSAQLGALGQILCLKFSAQSIEDFKSSICQSVQLFWSSSAKTKQIGYN